MSNENKPVNQEKMYRWVKAGDRLPDKDGQICVRIHKEDFSAAYVRTQKDASRVICGMATTRQVWPNWKNNLEWLEEYTPPSSQPSHVTGTHVGDIPQPIEGQVNEVGRELVKTKEQFLEDIYHEAELYKHHTGGNDKSFSDGAEFVYDNYVKAPVPAAALPPDSLKEMPDGYGIVYDKVFIPCKADPNEDYPSAICDFDDDEQRWEPGDRFVKAIAGPIAVIPASFYHALQSSLSSITKERDDLKEVRNTFNKLNERLSDELQKAIGERDALREGSQQWRDEYNIAREQRDALYKTATERIAYLIKTEKEAIDELDSKSVGSPERYSSWALIKELSSRRQELQQMFPKTPHQ